MIFQFVRTNLLAKKLRSFLTIFSIAISILLIISIVNISSQLSNNIIDNAGRYDVLLGAKGSSTQLILSTMFFYDAPLGNINKIYLENLEKDSRVEYAVPVGMGDNYRGYRIIGTQPKYFEGIKYSMAQGKLFEQEKEAVLGATVARMTGLTIGSEFSGSHGIGKEDVGIEDHHHDDYKYRVVGILSPTKTPNDMAIFTDIKSVWSVHGIEVNDEHTGEASHMNEDHVEAILDDAEHADSAHNDEGHHHHDHDKIITAILLKSKGFSEAYQITQEYNRKDDVQAINPAATLRQLLNTISIGEKVASLIAYISVILSVITLFIVMLSASAERRKDIAVLRALGANRGTVFNIILLETFAIAIIGSLSGFILAHLAIHLTGGVVASKLGLYISGASMSLAEPIIIVTAIVLSTLAGVIPGLLVYRTDVTKHLN